MVCFTLLEYKPHESKDFAHNVYYFIATALTWHRKDQEVYARRTVTN